MSSISAQLRHDLASMSQQQQTFSALLASRRTACLGQLYWQASLMH